MSFLRSAGSLIFGILLFGYFSFSSQAGTQQAHVSTKKQILFICTGNYYRSRFAEALFNELAKETHLEWQAVSRGLNLDASQHGISVYAQQELIKRGVPQKFYKGEPKALAKEDLQKSDYVVLMDEGEHRPLLEKRFPTPEEAKIHYWHIPETVRSDIPKACETMAVCVQNVMRKLDK